MAPPRNIRSLQTKHAVQSETIRRDPSPTGVKIMRWLKHPNSVTISLFVGAASAYMFPAFSDIALGGACALTWWALRQKEDMPLKMPIQSGLPDVKDVMVPGSKPPPGKGIFFFGNRWEDNKQLWITNDDCRQHFLVLGTTGSGKALADDAPVHTPTGWRLMRDLRLGDLVTTPDGRSAPVDGVYPQGVLDLHRLTFSDGRSAEACPEHLWEVRDATGCDRLMRTREIAQSLRAGTRGLTIRLPRPVERPPVALSVDPYVYGRSLALAHVPCLAGEGEAAAESAPGLPGAYAAGSVEQRLGLVRGLVEACGRPVADQIEVILPGRRVAEDVAEVIRSLGGLAHVSATPFGARLLVEHSDPVLLGGDRPRAPGSRPRLGIERIDFVRRAPARCIHIDHPDHLFITKDYVVTHNTENLLGFVTNALTWSSGFLFCDGKGDVSLFAKVFALARRFGREDDLLVLNMMTGNADVGGGGGHLLSNTLNPFATGSSDGLTQLVVGLMDEVGGDGAMWKGRATAMFTGVMKAMVYLRNEGMLDLNVGAIRDHLNLRKIIDLADVEKYPGISEDVRHSIRSYLTSLPGYQEEKKYKQAQTTLDQHGYLEMQFTKILGSLADVYGHVFKTPYGEIDMQDVVLNRRILVVMLPALEKSSDELANLGKIVVATLKGMMGSALGNRIEGTWDDIVDNRVTNSPSPFLVVLDEVGYYTVEGLALMAAQARSLGFSMIYASQDIPAMKRLNEKEAASIIANTNVKIFMKTEEMETTGKLAEESGGMGIRAETGGYGGRIGELGNAYSDNLEARFNSVNMVDKLDLKDFGAGDMLVMYKAEKIFARTFHADPPKAVKVGRLKLRANHFVKIARPNRSEIESANAMTTVLSRLVAADLPKEVAERDRIQREGVERAAEAGEEVALLAKALREGLAGKVDPKEAACAAVFAVSYAVAGSAAKFTEHRATHATKPHQALADAFPASPLDLDDDGYQDPHGAPPRDAFEDYGAYPTQGGIEDLDIDGPTERGSRDAFDPLAGLDEPVERAPRQLPPRGPRRPSQVQDVEHVMTLDERRLDASLRVDSNDSVLRVLADFDFDPNRTSQEDVEQRIHEATGAPTDPDGLQLAEPDYIDHTAFEADRAVEPAARPVAESHKGSHEEYISNILAELMEDGGDD